MYMYIYIVLQRFKLNFTIQFDSAIKFKLTIQFMLTIQLNSAIRFNLQWLACRVPPRARANWMEVAN